MQRSPLRMCVALAFTSGCGGVRAPEPRPEPLACALGENLAGDWVRVDSARAEARHRLRLESSEGGYVGTLIEGEERIQLSGARVGESIVLTERSGAGRGPMRRFYARVRPRSCALRMVEVRLGEDGREEQLAAGYVDLLPFPGGAALSWAICAEPARAGGGEDAPPLTVDASFTIAATSDPAADGSSRCDYTFDVYVDDHALPDRQGLPARVRRGQRVWETSLGIPYAGDHLVEIHRHRRCPDQPPALLGVACARADTR